MNGKNDLAALATHSVSDTESLVQKVVAARLQRAPSGGQMTLRINISLDPGSGALPGDDTRDPNDVPENSIGSNGAGLRGGPSATGGRKGITALKAQNSKPSVTGKKHAGPAISMKSGGLTGGITSISLAVTLGGGGASSSNVFPGVPGDDTQDPNNVPED